MILNKKSKLLAGDPFADYRAHLARDEAKPRIIGASYGEIGTLKTSLWAGAPGPILFQSTDNGTEGVIEPFQKQKEIYVINYETSTDTQTQESAQEIVNKFITDYEYFVNNGIRTVVWDKEDQVYAIFKFAELGAPTDAPNNYYPLFQRFQRLMNLAKSSSVNFGLIQGMKTPWVPKVNTGTGARGATADTTGRRVRRGNPEVPEQVHINIEHVLKTNDEGKPEFWLNIGKSRGPGGRDIQNRSFQFMEFSMLAQLMFPDTEEEDWK